MRRYVVRTGLYFEDRRGRKLEFVFCSSGEGGWLSATASHERREKCGALYSAGDFLDRPPCDRAEMSHEVIPLAEAHARGLITPFDNHSLSVTTAELLKALGLRTTKAWRAV